MDAVMNSFSTYCYEAKDKCSMYKHGDNAEDIENRLDGVLERFRESPVTFSNKKYNFPVVFKYNDLKTFLFQSLFNPTMFWTSLAVVLKELSDDNDGILEDFVKLPDLAPLCKSQIPYWAYPSDAMYAIMCSDKRYDVR